jgi:hypothetical protein
MNPWSPRFVLGCLLTMALANNPDTPLTAFQRPFNLRFSQRFEF